MPVYRKHASVIVQYFTFLRNFTHKMGIFLIYKIVSFRYKAYMSRTAEAE
ncbi:Uncharacterized protein dnm_076650 [Desulfonema magnum]|uniref:Uncharacterized protein n=1 Tax=Desulfonema magnum TaxID=45655 RepID=A0A975BTS8_9BACT|nr:Uncharacterized protein dnm_076650 [Desulfonema magnum]